MKTLISKILLLITVSVLFFELFAFLTSLLLTKQVLTSNPNDYVLSREHISSLKKLYNKDLGWDLKTGTQYGERPSLKDYKLDTVITFGDSFTYGNDVPDNCTWQEELELQLKQNVFNFGVGSYGVDQAFLKYQIKKKHFPNAKNVILTLIPGDINRNMNVYRNLVRTFEGSWPDLTKPYFSVKDGGEVIFNENPIQRLEDLDQLNDPHFIQTLMAKDWWHLNHHFPLSRFPYSLNFFDKNYLSQLITTLDYEPWFSKDGILVLEKILTLFSKEVIDSGAKPLILFVPDYYFIKNIFQGNQQISQIENIFLDICQRHHLTCRSAVSLYSVKSKASTLFNSLDESSHYSCKGNSMLAEFILKNLNAL